MNSKAIGLAAVGVIALMALGKRAVKAGPVLETPPPFEPPPPPKVLPAPETPAVTPMPYKPPPPTIAPPVADVRIRSPSGTEIVVPRTELANWIAAGWRPVAEVPLVPTTPVAKAIAPITYVRVSKLAVEIVIEAKDLATYKAAGWTEGPWVPTPTLVAKPTPLPMPLPTIVTPAAAVPSTELIRIQAPTGQINTIRADQWNPQMEAAGWIILAKPPTPEPMSITPTLFAVYYNRMRHPETGEEVTVADEDEDLYEQEGFEFVERVRVG